jgi:DNA polymerase-3 subunit gamma/tau
VAYQVFARKYRPLTFDQILGQDHVVQTLRNAIAKERIAQAYLFVGPRGTGKTTTARILAKALNCTNGPSADFDPHEGICKEIAEGNSLDVLEIDGASNNGVEQVRELRDNAKFAPSHGRYKIYYIDEVHMLTTAAFNALLKTLEEPPPHVKFIFATTEPNKILPTVLSRCQRFDLRPIPEPIIAEHLLHIAKEENVQLDDMAAHSIAKGADGGMRDAQSMLDQLVAFCGAQISESHVLDIFGFTSHETVAKLTTGILEHRTVDALNVLHEQTEAGKDLTKLLADLITYCRNLLVYKVDPNNALKETAKPVAEAIRAQAELVATERLLDLIDHFAEIDARMKWAPNKKMHFEIGVIKAVQKLQESNLSDVIKVLSGAISDAPALPVAAAPVQVAVPPATPQAPPVPAVITRVAAPASAPSPPPAASAPEPMAEVAAAQPQESSISDDPQDIWRRLQTKFPMIFSQAAFDGVEESRLMVRFHSTDFGKERATSTRGDIDKFLKGISGKDLRLDVYIDDAVPMGPSANPPKTANPADALNSPPFDQAPRGGGQSPVANAGSAQPGAPVKPPPTAPLNEQAFYEDPLIQKALDMFEATLEKKD